MSTAPATRAVLRQSRYLLRRNNVRQASTAAETATKAKETATQITSKASEGLSRVKDSGESAVSGAVSGVRNSLTKIGGRTGRIIAFVDSLIPPTIYYSRVGLELSKIVFRGQKMSPPTISQFSSYFQPVINAARNPRTIVSSVSSAASAANPESMLSSIRNLNTQQIITFGVVGAEVLGFFTVGTMIGRMKIVGYHGGPHHEH